MDDCKWIGGRRRKILLYNNPSDPKLNTKAAISPHFNTATA